MYSYRVISDTSSYDTIKDNISEHKHFDSSKKKGNIKSKQLHMNFRFI